jgi:hypothetical protein
MGNTYTSDFYGIPAKTAIGKMQDPGKPLA